MADDTITRGGIRGLGSPLYISSQCSLSPPFFNFITSLPHYRWHSLLMMSMMNPQCSSRVAAALSDYLKMHPLMERLFARYKLLMGTNLVMITHWCRMIYLDLMQVCIKVFFMKNVLSYRCLIWFFYKQHYCSAGLHLEKGVLWNEVHHSAIYDVIYIIELLVNGQDIKETFVFELIIMHNQSHVFCNRFQLYWC